ncbi:GRP family sugar transporter [Lactiplantibacillus paraplantarum]|uniref:Glucose uptake protein n=1 Tax=Lactiplantibacillus paraplantarum TaxID=60520 RepID=A0AAD0TR18_9LACO|nr:GRP family sugar transporter [Lactiplantibacillus paraplantarum]AYJ40050.1 hypothetical protein LP667_15220 [Lactiplantibacillus paraplantarum]ERL45868.1 glucose uptake protein GlcU [Lactiplantibacillus paraplantarum]KRL47329.1 sugar transport protein [Lactiplantibacillus paraplantarum DSM 10667]MCU4685123.1 GRP family sugar transporter [Lactiplantibacillus paraplantarum]QJU50897.1 putative sugar uptake protein [Lactiplantibacillus paraplantarum]
MWVITVGLIPALFWGILPIWIRKITGGDLCNQLLGTTIGITVVALLLTISLHLTMNWQNGLIFFLSGFCWSIGQVGQYYCYEHLGVSATMPLSTALQIIGNSIIGGIVFHEWHGSKDVLLSLIMLVVVLAGIHLTSEGGNVHSCMNRSYVILGITTIGYWGYSALPHFAQITSNLNGFLPQALGMLVASIVISGPNLADVWRKSTVNNISTGVIFSVAAATYLISLTLNGMVNAFILSQLNVVVATILGGFILHEFVKGQFKKTLIGLIVLLCGATGLIMV